MTQADFGVEPLDAVGSPSTNGEVTGTRDRQGRFVRSPGPGRKRGGANRHARLRDAMYDCLERNPGGLAAFLDKLRDDCPVDFVRILARLEPREHRVQGELRTLVMNVYDAIPPPTQRERIGGPADDRFRLLAADAR